MKSLSKQEASDFLATATITETSIEEGIEIAHRGTGADGTAFVLINGRDDEISLFFTTELSSALDMLGLL